MLGVASNQSNLAVFSDKDAKIFQGLFVEDRISDLQKTLEQLGPLCADLCLSGVQRRDD